MKTISEKDTLIELAATLYGKDKNAYTYIGWEGTEATAFETIADGYFLAAEAVFQKFQSSAGDYRVLDGVGYPICFLYRHYMELTIKGLFFRHADESKRKEFIKTGHDLEKLWKSIKPVIEKLQKRVVTTISIAAIENYIIQMHKFDNKSFSMRYPINNDLSPMHSESLKINIVNLHDRMQDFRSSIQQLDDEISNQVLYDIPKDQLTAMKRKISKYKKDILRCLEFIKKAGNSHTELKDHTDYFQRLLNGELYTEDERNLYQFFKNQNFEFQNLIYDIYYCGKEICSRHLAKDARERKKDVLKILVDKNSQQVEEDTILSLFKEKAESILFQNIHRTLKELGMIL